MTENQCHFVSSHGLMKQCDLFQTDIENPNLAYEVSRMKKGQTLFLNTNIVLAFQKRFWKVLKVPIILVSGNGNDALPKHVDDSVSLAKLLEEPLLIHWFSQNNTIAHTKITLIPVGVDQHTLQEHLGSTHPWGPGMLPLYQEAQLKEVQKIMKPWDNRHTVAYCNQHFLPDRKEIRTLVDTITPGCIYKHDESLTRLNLWQVQSLFAFVLCPLSDEQDTHITWEALCLGAVPIIKSSPMDRLQDGLPVWIIKDWSEITAESMQQKKHAQSLVENKKPVDALEPLRLNFWWKKIEEMQKTVTQADSS